MITEDEMKAITAEEYPFDSRFTQTENLEIAIKRNAYRRGLEKMQSLISTQGGMRFVKASEKLPEFYKHMYVRDNVGCNRLGNFYEDEDGLFFHVDKTSAYESFTIPQKDFWSIEWLDETPSLSESDTEDPVIAALKKHTKQLIEAGPEACRKYLGELGLGDYLQPASTIQK